MDEESKKRMNKMAERLGIEPEEVAELAEVAKKAVPTDYSWDEAFSKSIEGVSKSFDRLRDIYPEIHCSPLEMAQDARQDRIEKAAVQYLIDMDRAKNFIAEVGAAVRMSKSLRRANEKYKKAVKLHGH